MTRTQVMGAGILALLALAQAAGGTQAHAPATTQAGITQAQASADWYAEAALRDTDTEGRAFRKCIRGGQRVYTRTFVGRECVAPDGERWFAGLRLTRSASGMVTQARLVTGP